MKRWVIIWLGFVWSCQKAVPPMIPKPQLVTDAVEAEGDEIFDPKIDILFVIDDSGSMSSHQRNLANNVDLFINNFLQRQDIDYHIGVITTSNSPSWSGRGVPCCGKLVDLAGVTYVTRTTPNASWALKRNMLVGTNGDSREMIFDPLASAIDVKNSQHNQGFFRDDAFLAIVIISDAEDQSQKETPQSIAQKLTLFKGKKDRWTAFGVIVPTIDPYRCERDEFNVVPTRIELFLDLAKLDPSTQNVYNLCDPAFGQNLAKIGEVLSYTVGNIIYLKRVPIVSTIQVWYGTQRIDPHPTQGWSYDPARNAIVLGSEIQWSQQPPGTRVRVRYESYRDPIVNEALCQGATSCD